MGVSCTNDNVTYVAGNYQNALYAAERSIESFGWQDIFLAGYNNSGNILSLETVGGKGNDEVMGMSVSNNDDLVFCGLITDTVSMGTAISEGLGQRLFISRRLNSGDYAWITTLSPTDEYSSSIYLITGDNDGNIYAAGIFGGTLSSGNKTITSKGGSDIFIVKINSLGAVLNLMSFGSQSDDYITGLSVDQTGRIYTTGSAKADFYVDQYRITADINNSGRLSADPFILCFNKDFSVAWVSQIDGVEYTVFSGLKQDSNQNTYAVGNYNMTLSIGDSSYVSKGYSDMFLIKYNSDGSINWSRSFGSDYYDYSMGIILGSTADVVISGTLGNDLVVDNVNLTGHSAFIISFSDNGESTWGDIINGTGSTEGYQAGFNSDGNLHLAGSFNYGNILTATDTLVSKGDQDLFLAFYASCQEIKNEISGQPFICSGDSTTLYVNQLYHNVQWNNGIMDQHNITTDQAGLYSVKLSDEKGCNQTDSLNVVYAEEFALGEDVRISIDSSVLLYAPETFKNYLWQDGSTGDSFLATAENYQPGKRYFSLKAEDTLGCIFQDTICIEFYNTNGLIQNSIIDLKVYPVPVKSSINVDFDDLSVKILSVEIINQDGRPVLIRNVEKDEASPIAINVSKIPSGLYYIRLKTKNSAVSKAIIIMH